MNRRPSLNPIRTVAIAAVDSEKRATSIRRNARFISIFGCRGSFRASRIIARKGRGTAAQGSRDDASMTRKQLVRQALRVSRALGEELPHGGLRLLQGPRQERLVLASRLRQIRLPAAAAAERLSD